jgi:4-amino-4-deoxy-L-arabinose transferase-like glycosyltransferase
MFSFLRQTSPTRLAVCLIFAVTFFRLWYINQIGLVADEAYYWLWSMHPALSYRDKGPLVAWIIWVGTHLFGNTVFGIRFFDVLLSSFTGWLIFALARRLYDERTALWCLLVALVVPEMAIGSILMTIDTPSVLCWAAAVLLFWNALHNNKISTWFWLGLVIGIGFLAKFTNGVQLICIAFFLLWVKEYRSLFISWKTVVMCLAFLLASIPIFVWNAETGWVHLMALHSRSGVTDTFQIQPAQLLRFIGEQFGVVSPFIMLGIVWAAIALLPRFRQDVRIPFLLSQFLPLYALFAFFALNKAGQPNWTVPALVTGIILAVVFWRELMARKPAWRWVVKTAFVITAIGIVCFHVIIFLPIPRDLNLMHRAQGWPDMAAHVQKARMAEHADILIGADYSIASLMAFYLPDRPTTYMPPEPYGSSQFTLWPTYKVTPTTRALFVRWEVYEPPTVLKQQFSHITLTDQFWTQYHGRPMKQVAIYLCTP